MDKKTLLVDMGMEIGQLIRIMRLVFSNELKARGIYERLDDIETRSRIDDANSDTIWDRICDAECAIKIECEPRLDEIEGRLRQIEARISGINPEIGG